MPSTAVTQRTDAAYDPLVLVVDDDFVNRQLLHKTLERAGIRHELLSSGLEALEAVTRLSPDVLLLDVMMEGLDGFSTAQKLRQEHGLTELPILFITCLQSPEDLARGFAAGGTDYITKPFNPREVVSRVRVHLENQRLLKLQRSSIDQLEASTRLKNRILGVVTHDLKNPVASIVGLTEMLLEEDADLDAAERTEMLRAILSAGQSLQPMLEDLLNYAAEEMQESALKRTPFSLADMLRDVRRLYAGQARQKAIELHIEQTAEAATTPVLADASRLRRAIDNLVSNAIKYSPGDTTVTLSCGQTKDGFWIEVRDQGPGIPEDDLGALFQLFGTTRNRTTAGEQSLGLGLSTVKTIVEAHAGQVSVRNGATRGAIFRVEIPQALGLADDASAEDGSAALRAG